MVTCTHSQPYVLAHVLVVKLVLFMEALSSSLSGQFTYKLILADLSTMYNKYNEENPYYLSFCMKRELTFCPSPE